MDAKRSVIADFDELLGLLHLVARGDPPSREQAVSYLNCRSRLLASESGDMLPGFLYQCGTIDRFREFIFLYDPDVTLRHQFLDRMIDRARTLHLAHADAAGEGGRERPDRPAPSAASIAWDF